MLKLSKRVEYGLLSIQYMAQQPQAIVSAKDIAEQFNISFTLVAKVLQQLVRAGVVRSFAGVRGGYALAKPAADVSVAAVIEAIEGTQNGLVECQEEHDHVCSAQGTCTLREPLQVLHDRIVSTFASMTVAELATPQLIQITTFQTS